MQIGHGGAIGIGKNIDSVRLRKPGAMHQHAAAGTQREVYPAPRLVCLQGEGGQLPLGDGKGIAGIGATKRPAFMRNFTS